MKISESTYKQMPSELKSLFIKLPNYGSEEVLELMPNTTSGKMKQHIEGGQFNVYGKQYSREVETIGDSGSAARFFYTAKASKRDRDEGCEGLPVKVKVFNGQSDESSADMKDVESRFTTAGRNIHPTVKPTNLMRYLCRLITPPNGIVLDPFMGSGSTGKAAILEGFRFMGLDITEEYMPIAEARVKWAEKNVGIGIEEDEGEEQEARGEDGVDPTLF